MPEPVDPRDEEELEPVHFPDSELETLEASVRRLLDQTTAPATARQSGPVGPPPSLSPFAGFPMTMPPPTPPAVEPRFILTLDGEEFETELDALADWVHDFLLDTYGAEISTAAPWCQKWQEHLDVVGWLHSLWMAYQQHIDPEAGLAGPAVWHRDFLTHTMAAVRAPNGPLSACMTDADRPSHRLLATPTAATAKPAATTIDAAEVGLAA
ncbi:DUF4913 domain-containing protein [Streptomyces sp. NPDC051561]|uniref:DUF4913 domain-containing protein n=1 Tax=Streptomyces sp. NPDC051561 TaxID=3365658 RepID=UPI0037939E3A